MQTAMPNAQRTFSLNATFIKNILMLKRIIKAEFYTEGKYIVSMWDNYAKMMKGGAIYGAGNDGLIQALSLSIPDASCARAGWYASAPAVAPHLSVRLPRRWSPSALA